MSITGNITRSGITRNVTRGVTESFFSGLTPALHAAFAEDKSLVSRIGPTFSITRATNAKYRDSSGVVQTASSGVARFDHSASGASLGLLIEPLRTNIALHSNDWANAAYDTVTNITPLKDATGPDGVANSASTLTATADNGVISQSITVVSAARTTSVWMKRKTGTGTVEITDNGFTNATDITADINSSTWTQVGKITRTQANPVVGVRLGTSGDEVEVAYLQCEAGSTATSPIETTTTSVARNADIITTSDLSWLNQSAGSVFVDTTPVYADLGATNEVMLWYLLNSGTNYHIFSISTASTRTGYGRVNVRNSASISQENNEDSFVSGTRSRAVYGYDFDTNALRVIVDGGNLGSTDSNTTTAPTPNNLYIGSLNDGTLSVGGHIREIRYYNTLLNNAQLEAMSNGVFP